MSYVEYFKTNMSRYRDISLLATVFLVYQAIYFSSAKIAVGALVCFIAYNLMEESNKYNIVQVLCFNTLPLIFMFTWVFLCKVKNIFNETVQIGNRPDLAKKEYKNVGDKIKSVIKSA